ncbi:MAG TPA: recombinase family protein [Ktedonobacteraceae bacterium]|nr:recombinase family protein [Ktedonobacteraceae bacterium]
MRAIQPGKKLIEPSNYGQETLPIDKPIVQYVRQSTSMQVLKNTQSAVMQDKNLRRKLVGYGWKDSDETIILIDDDTGKSGQKRRDERKGLDRLYKLIERGQVGSVACYDVSRIYRDLTRMEYTGFVHNICETYNIPVITYNRVYYPSRKEDMEQLIADFAEAAKRIQWMHDVPLAAKLAAIEENASFAGGKSPMGYIPVGNTGQKHFIIYEPHARLVRRLYKRYRELDGNMGKLLRELSRTGFAFPAFTGIKNIPPVPLDFVEGVGYVIKRRGGLAGILSNPVYIGWYVFDNVLVSKEAHLPIVDMDDFLYAYTRISPTLLDGTPNEQKPKIERRSAEKKALLDGVLESDGKPVYATMCKGTYSVRIMSGFTSVTELVISIAKLDAVFSDAMRNLLFKLEQRHAKGLRDSLYNQLTAALAEQTEQDVNYTKQLADIATGIRQAELDKKVSKEEEYEPGVREAIKQLKRLHAAREALEAKSRQTGKEKAELAECKSLLDLALRSWDALPFEKQRRFVKLLVTSVNIKAESSHFIRVDIHLRPPFNYSLYGYMYRVHGTRPAWTEEEIETLTRLYPHADRVEVLQALPSRSWENIIKQACAMRLKRYTSRNTSDMHTGLTYSDYTLAVEREIESLGSPIRWVMNLSPNKNNVDSSLMKQTPC